MTVRLICQTLMFVERQWSCAVDIYVSIDVHTTLQVDFGLSDSTLNMPNINVLVASIDSALERMTWFIPLQVEFNIYFIGICFFLKNKLNTRFLEICLNRSNLMGLNDMAPVVFSLNQIILNSNQIILFQPNYFYSNKIISISTMLFGFQLSYFKFQPSHVHCNHHHRRG